MNGMKNMENMIKVGMADLNTATCPNALTTLGLGSCVGIVLFDPVKKIGGMAHVMLPDSTKIRNNENKAKFADTGIDLLLSKMIVLGATKEKVIAKIAGGAQMFALKSDLEFMNVGKRNVEASKQKLKELHIPIVSEDTGSNYGRTIEFYTHTGELVIKAVGKQIAVI